MTEGEQAERRVAERLRAALPAEYEIYQNVGWISLRRSVGATTPAGGAPAGLRNGEVDVVIAHAERGFLAIEVKAGDIRRDGAGRWWAGPNLLRQSPFSQARVNRYGLVGKLRSLPDWPAALQPIAGWAVALPDADLATAGAMRRYLGPDADDELVLDGTKLETNEGLRRAVERAYGIAAIESSRARSPGPLGVGLARALLAGPLELHARLGRTIREDEPEVLELTRSQAAVLGQLRHQARVEVVGPAGTGKTILACEKARSLALEGFVTLLVCFNQPLARAMTEQLEAEIELTGRLVVTTFHQLCEDLAREAGTLPAKPARPGAAWFGSALPTALLDAIDRLGPRFNAIVVDEGQDFELGWLESLQLLLHDPGHDVLYVFHDPAQAIYRDDRVGELSLQRLDLTHDCRNPGRIHDLAARFYDGDVRTIAMRAEGRSPEIIVAEAGAATVEALRTILHRLRHDEDVPPWEIVVLIGSSLEDSPVWRVPGHRYGNEVLWNGQVDDAGNLRGLAFDQVEDQPSDTILIDSIRRFKGLDRPVVILAELRTDDVRLGRLLYIGLSRARHHLIVIAPASIAGRLG